eukprot:TRINITY_DN14659_c0_g1_i2.p2 TRINITY_DN14659_c0_g1~~TRINITY_DN14659_c0_g1_i2.p2  ORF type:complete len:139 (-),score=20.00 TRINITY_DN14659_c0_g1_i2:75-491(-)
MVAVVVVAVSCVQTQPAFHPQSKGRLVLTTEQMQAFHPPSKRRLVLTTEQMQVYSQEDMVRLTNFQRVYSLEEMISLTSCRRTTVSLLYEDDERLRGSWQVGFVGLVYPLDRHFLGFRCTRCVLHRHEGGSEGGVDSD